MENSIRLRVKTAIGECPYCRRQRKIQPKIGGIPKERLFEYEKQHVRSVSVVFEVDKMDRNSRSSKILGMIGGNRTVSTPVTNSEVRSGLILLL
ncbi:hypothetical protein JTB14_037800 [Gonioctena quinquepunctata]|nr:hypothetical protein JTB14_037800 [Gonioctena quinquepunctata]